MIIGSEVYCHAPCTGPTQSPAYLTLRPPAGGGEGGLLRALVSHQRLKPRVAQGREGKPHKSKAPVCLASWADAAFCGPVFSHANYNMYPVSAAV